MTLSIKKSQLGSVSESAFSAAVDAHVQELRWHREHHDAIKGGEKRDPYPDPVAHALVDAAIRQDGLIPDYVIEDDVTPTIEHRKSMLVVDVAAVARAASEKVRPAGKRALDGILYGEARAKVRVDIVDEEQVTIDDRSPEEKELCSAHEDRLAKLSRIERWSAEAQSAIEDLTEENIGAWAMPALPEEKS